MILEWEHAVEPPRRICSVEGCNARARWRAFTNRLFPMMPEAVSEPMCGTHRDEFQGNNPAFYYLFDFHPW